MHSWEPKPSEKIELLGGTLLPTVLTFFLHPSHHLLWYLLPMVVATFLGASLPPLLHFC